MSLVRPADVWHPVWSRVIGAAMPFIVATYVGIADSAVGRGSHWPGRGAARATRRWPAGCCRASPWAATWSGAMIESAEDRFDNTDEHAAATLARKTAADEAVIDTVRLSLELAGGVGYARSTRASSASTATSTAPCSSTPPGAKQLEFSGRLALGLSPF